MIIIQCTYPISVLATTNFSQQKDENDEDEFAENIP